MGPARRGQKENEKKTNAKSMVAGTQPISAVDNSRVPFAPHADQGPPDGPCRGHEAAPIIPNHKGNQTAVIPVSAAVDEIIKRPSEKALSRLCWKCYNNRARLAE